jgi:hypothetical protein
MNATIRLLLIVLLVILLLGLLPVWPYTTNLGWGWYPSGGLGLILLVVIVLAVMGSSGDRRLVR